MYDFDNLPYFSYTDRIDLLLSPISQYTDLQLHAFTRKYNNKSRYYISSNKEHLIDYFSHEFYRYGYFEKDPHKYESGYHMWDHLPCDPNGIYEHGRRVFSLAHGLTIVQQHGEYCDFFLFTSNPHNSLVNNFYLNHKEKFLKFIEDFYGDMNPVLQELYNHTIVVPNNIADASEKYKTLSPRQQDCVLLLAAGLTAKEIAKTLELSPRTVEEHINTLKTKFDAKNRTHLLGLMKKYL